MYLQPRGSLQIACRFFSVSLCLPPYDHPLRALWLEASSSHLILPPLCWPTGDKTANLLKCLDIQLLWVTSPPRLATEPNTGERTWAPLRLFQVIGAVL